VKRPRVEILYFEGCPNYEDARALVERLAARIGVDPDLQLVEVPDEQAAVRLRFLGSPSVRVDGRDVEPGANERSDFVLSCRVYPGGRGLAGAPDEEWIRDALTAAVS
jgi:hypothetical protein